MIKDVVIAIVFASAICFCAKVENEYTMKAEVISVVDLETVAVDETGETWVFFSDDLKVNDIIKIKFDSNHTHKRKDDKIINYDKVLK